MGAIGLPINPRKLYRFAVECEGLETAYVQKCKIPKIEVKTAKHGEGPFVQNTASKVEFGHLELDTLKPSESSAVWWKDWLALIINLNDGSMGTPDLYKKTLFIVEYASDGETIVDRWEIQGAFPIEIEPSELEKLGEGNALDKLKFCVDRVVTDTSSGGDLNLTAFAKGLGGIANDVAGRIGQIKL